MLTLTDLICMYHRWIVAALDAGDDERLITLIARRDDILRRARVLDEPDVIEAEAA